MSHPLPYSGPGAHFATTAYVREGATINVWRMGDFVAATIEGPGTAHSICLRPDQWAALIDAVHTVMPAETVQGLAVSGDVVAVRGDDLQRLLGFFALLANSDRPSVLHIWVDPLDKAVKFKTGSGTWTRPYGRIEEETA